MDLVYVLSRDHKTARRSLGPARLAIYAIFHKCIRSTIIFATSLIKHDRCGRIRLAVQEIFGRLQFRWKCLVVIFKGLKLSLLQLGPVISGGTDGIIDYSGTVDF